MNASPPLQLRAWGTQTDSPKVLQRSSVSRRVVLTPLFRTFCPRSLRSSRDLWCLTSHNRYRRPICPRAGISIVPQEAAAAALKITRTALTRSWNVIGAYPVHVQCAVAAGVITFAVWGLMPAIQLLRRNLFQRRDWDKSRTKYIFTSYIRPLILWGAVLVICRGLDPIVLSSERSQAVKERFVNFLRYLSTVLTFAFCTARMTQQVQKVMMERRTTEDSRNLGIRFIGTAVSTSVWVAAVCLFMELLGFSTQKWLTAGGFGTVLLTLAGREIVTNFLSSVMIHATRPFVEYEWIQTKIDGQEVSGTVEHVGWWSPTVIRGEDREAVHIPNHKFTMSVVRNLSQKTHWRVKTYIGLSHLDANKINLIVADMRKVLSKHPQVEHRRLHRRVFFDNVDPVNQSLMIMVSCFVKTSHYEEYLSVKEIILLNLMKVISHHNARLATPIRSIHRVYDETETRHSPFRNVAAEDSSGKPLLLVEASAVTTEPSKSKDIVNTPGTEPTRAKTLDQQVEPPTKPPLEGLDSMGLNPNDISLLGAAFEKRPAKVSTESATDEEDESDVSMNNETERAQHQSDSVKTKSRDGKLKPQEVKAQDGGKLKSQESKPKPQEMKSQDGKLKPQEVKSQAKPQEAKSQAKPQEAKSQVKPQEVKSQVKPQETLKPNSQEESNSQEAKLKQPEEMKSQEMMKSKKGDSDSEAFEDDPWRQTSPAASQDEKNKPQQHSAKKPSTSLEENLVLGVALAGSKRTLPLDDEILNGDNNKESPSSRQPTRRES